MNHHDDESVGGITHQLCQDKRRTAEKFSNISRPQRVMLTYELPLNEIVLDFYDPPENAFRRGYSSLDYHLAGYNANSYLIKLAGLF